MNQHPVGWVSRETLTDVTGGKDHLSTEVGWQRPPTNPQNVSGYPQSAHISDPIGSENEAGVPDDV
jgi:hypothetical protein